MLFLSHALLDALDNMIITDVQQKIIETLRLAIESGGGTSMREIGELVGGITANSVFYHIQKLEEKGLLVRDSNGKVIRINSPQDNHAVAFLPLLGNVACGRPLDQLVDENTSRLVPVPLFLLGRNNKKNLYLVKAVGDSMSPKIEDGDFIAFEPVVQPNQGDIVVARTSQGFTVKVFRTNDQQYILQPLNPKHQPFVFDKDSSDAFNIDGVAVGVIKSEHNLRGTSMM